MELFADFTLIDTDPKRFLKKYGQLGNSLLHSNADIPVKQVENRLYRSKLKLRNMMESGVQLANRVDETTDLYDGYSINRPFSSSASCERVGYDAESKTATFLITITEWGNQDISGDKITFSIREFLSHKNSYKGLEIPIDLSRVQIAYEIHFNDRIISRLKLLIHEVLQEEFNTEIANSLNMKNTNKQAR